MKRYVEIFIVCAIWFHSAIAVAALQTVERWQCSRSTLSRILRHVANSPGAAPCKVFYYKHVSAEEDAKVEARQDAGTEHPIYYSEHTNDFCTKKMQWFLEDRESHGWTCSRL